jgi:alanine racemase
MNIGGKPREMTVYTAVPGGYHPEMRATRALVHLSNLRHNLERLRDHTGPGPRFCLAVKADAYGHGIVPVGRGAAAAGIEYLAVATVDEAVELREGGLQIPILLYSLPTPEEVPEVVRHGATPVVSDLEIVDLIQAEARSAGTVVPVHLKVDTGMGRIGCRPEDAAGVAAGIAERENVKLEGLSTHFASSDSRDRDQTESQIAAFNRAIESIRQVGVNPGLVHAGNSGGLVQYPAAWYDMVRPGILAYGYYPSDEVDRNLGIRPVMELRSRVIQIKEVEPGSPVSYGATWRAPRRTCIATVPVGYGDGYNRLLSNRAEVGIGGRRFPIVGRVCMDHIMVDLGPAHDVHRFDDVVLFGPDETGPDAEELATLCDTIPYEITCAVSKRVPRIYVD